MNDRPSAAELVEAVRLFLERELLPTIADQRLKFQALVAANVLSIAGRELAGEEAQLAEEREALRPFVGDEPAAAGPRAAVRAMNERLCARIRAGELDQRAGELRALLRRQVVRKLEVANPRCLQERSPT
jgi:hypothetical protein